MFNIISRYRYPELRRKTPENQANKNGDHLQITLVNPDNTSPSYRQLLYDPKWKEKRNQIIERDGKQCVVCHSDKSLNVHHRQYHFIEKENCFKLPWEYEASLLVTLCQDCHHRGHSKFRVPTLTI